jgi:NAD(P)-dependent dehydrogenase (short-subunit alcohol dehydrogenase family)
MPDMKIAVTGGSGKAGRAVVRHLLEQGHDVLNVDGVEGTDTLLSIDRARRVLGYAPEFTWRELF